MKTFKFEAGKTYWQSGGYRKLEVVKRTKCYVWVRVPGVEGEGSKHRIEFLFYTDLDGEREYCEYFRTGNIDGGSDLFGACSEFCFVDD